MGADASVLHEDDYKHFLSLSITDQQAWLRKIPIAELEALRERAREISGDDRLEILSLVRDCKSRQGTPFVHATPFTQSDFDDPDVFQDGDDSTSVSSPGSSTISRSSTLDRRRSPKRAPQQQQRRRRTSPGRRATKGGSPPASPPSRSGRGAAGGGRGSVTLPDIAPAAARGSGSGDGDSALLLLPPSPSSSTSSPSSHRRIRERRASQGRLLDGALDSQRCQSGAVVALSLVNVGLDFSLEELAPVFSSTLLTCHLNKNPGLCGDVAALAPCTGLEELNLEGCPLVGGDLGAGLGAAAQANTLTKVFASALPALRGDLAFFAPCTRLKKLWLRSTGVSGDVGEAFARASCLVDLILSRCSRVRGDLAVFAVASRLQTLGMARTQVSGSVSVFRQSAHLRLLNLDFCPHLRDADIESRDELQKKLPNCRMSF